jgi:hypothetical protein
MNNDKFKYKAVYKLLNNNIKNNLVPLYSEDFFINPLSTNFLNFYYYNNDSNYESLEDSYENLKNFKFLYLKNYQNLIVNSNNSFLPRSYTSILDSFRADFDQND